VRWYISKVRRSFDDGVAIQITAPLCEVNTITVDFNDLGGFDGQVLRSLDEDLVEFETT
jgi:hypothetical protein